MDIYLVRHTSLNADKAVCYGQSEVHLASTFLQEASDTVKLIPDRHNAVFVASPLRRCVQLAEYLSRRPPMTDKRILDLNFGDWELKRWEDIDQIALDEWTRNAVNSSCPNGESYKDLFNRSVEFFDDLTSKNQKSAVIVTHASVIRCMLMYVLSIPFERSFDMRIAYGSVSKIKIEDSTVSIDFINRI
ncbi:MAG: alpha-ribazole phosphatase family protein [Ignavibacteria bacterium]|nr:alpha-ribazole phosphatase family protein [Ignavibacteria bacterium]